MLAIKQPQIKLDKPSFYGLSDEELNKIRQERLKRIQEFKRIEKIYYPY